MMIILLNHDNFLYIINKEFDDTNVDNLYSYYFEMCFPKHNI